MGLAIRLLGAIKATALFAVRRPKEAAIILLAALLALTFWRLYREQAHARELAAKIDGLPPDTKQAVTIYHDRVVTRWRRYSMTVALTPRFGGVGVSRHIDDFTPFRNIELLWLGGINWQGRLQLGSGLRFNLKNSVGRRSCG
ncbi:MAG: hypothetical protein HY549_11560 [Elusimicrobia bacterium]|nr:hypothetical protein [Elusimicrobiota bacterium]